MKSAIIATLVASAAAFAPAQQKASSTSLAAFEDELGVQPPLGFFDPLGMLDGASQERFDQLRYTELKHGRVSMLAFLGFITQTAGIRLGGDIDYHGTAFADIPAGAGALAAVPKGGWVQIFAFVLVLEFIMRDNSGDGEFVGDFRSGTIDFGWDTFDEEEKMSKRAIELNNGRAAQMGILGLMVHEQLGNLDTVLPL
mmetsp:Transcript_20086/g.41636  ORF Transcript_20086/g.41636 Transcript_20086/m.41636 type:complete len:198 (+) Transcript_20086:298-891(+)|eukprot:CAMPEP_0201115704 /NCGR_PEP_ID=MMETSP0850-20130426/55_1 /ASSEMBLY_ACC=CAM_ASM_000622 /TAXON_ID=183588 /ORGANISM="Pseudo-nitzschia fraudulenta, Strain WWA7" /LENGTH=197 /DNA_ID=CAMNT_0047379457 /DNA_START=320 /DNA_END=913 /DNA_ORIENTATION=-